MRAFPHNTTEFAFYEKIAFCGKRDNFQLNASTVKIAIQRETAVLHVSDINTEPVRYRRGTVAIVNSPVSSRALV